MRFRSEKTSLQIPPDMALIPMWPAALPGGSQSELYPRILNRQMCGQPVSYYLSRTVRWHGWRRHHCQWGPSSFRHDLSVMNPGVKSIDWWSDTIPQATPRCSWRSALNSMLKQGLCKAWHMPPSGKLSVGIWKIRFREKWNMVKTDDSQWVTKKSEQSTQAFVR
jgi:hypothetical protein